MFPSQALISLTFMGCLRPTGPPLAVSSHTRLLVMKFRFATQSSRSPDVNFSGVNNRSRPGAPLVLVSIYLGALPQPQQLTLKTTKSMLRRILDSISSKTILITIFSVSMIACASERPVAGDQPVDPSFRDKYMECYRIADRSEREHCLHGD